MKCEHGKIKKFKFEYVNEIFFSYKFKLKFRLLRIIKDYFIFILI